MSRRRVGDGRGGGEKDGEREKGEEYGRMKEREGVNVRRRGAEEKGNEDGKMRTKRVSENEREKKNTKKRQQ